MLDGIIPWNISVDKVAIAGTCLWALALYLGFASLREWITFQWERWFNFAEGFLYTSKDEFEKTRVAREAQNAFYASLFSIIPFLIAGGLFNYGVNVGLGKSWAISVGILACVACGVYDLGRRNTP
ncbi:hypothetical protein [Gloeocapsa sp. PCC 73106]|uniref:hypothetical protein n=1 Tax=Gloeocapsa sp. PCC 73106 TaxID=102232 RepID=UPI0002AB9A9A|nr:hypothetical protein [Gloeocapsa sp. PCC 73106]ELR96762.1 hypothetical protein GLO73106DRAFT_00005600 [Gloeocapsa sp. PCC 73106]